MRRFITMLCVALASYVGFAVFAPTAAQAQVVSVQIGRPYTPVVVARAVGTDEESVAITTLAGFDASTVDMRTILLVGTHVIDLLDPLGF